jgi:hypothetical protein
MKKEQHNLQDMLGAFVNEEHREEATRWLFPLLSMKGKKQAKEVWQDMNSNLSPEAFNKICDIVQQLTNIDIRSNKLKNRQTSFAQFLVSYALYYEFVTTKKVTLKELCDKHMPWLKHSQVLYAIHAIEKNIGDTLLAKLLLPFAEALHKEQLLCVWQRLVQLQLKATQNEVK